MVDWRIQDPMPPGGRAGAQTVREAFFELWAQMWDSVGHTVTCPVCGRQAGIRRQSISPKMASDFLRLVKIHVRAPGIKKLADFSAGGKRKSKSQKLSSDLPYLRHWKLLEKPSQKTYRLLGRGSAWAYDFIKVPARALLYDNRLVLQWSPELITLREALTSKRQSELKDLPRNFSSKPTKKDDAGA